MDDVKALPGGVLQRIETLASVRLEKNNWAEAQHLTREERPEAASLAGAKDALDYLGMLLSGETKT
jgi:hypothetical protein